MKTLLKICIFLSVLFFGLDTAKAQKDISKNDSVTNAYNHNFKDSLGNIVKLSDFKGKLIIVDIWYSGCGACVQCNNGMSEVHKMLKDKKDLVFMSISIDEDYDVWMNSITQGAKATKTALWPGRYKPYPGTITVNTGGSGENNIFIKKYVPTHAYPKLLLFDKSGKLVSSNPPRPDYNPTGLSDYILKYLN